MKENEASEERQHGTITLKGEHLFVIFVTTTQTAAGEWHATYCRGDVTKLLERVKVLTAKDYILQDICHPYKHHESFVALILKCCGSPEPIDGLEYPISERKAQRIIRDSRRLPSPDWLLISSHAHAPSIQTVEV